MQRRCGIEVVQSKEVQSEVVDEVVVQVVDM